MLRVILADDHPIYRDGLRLLLASSPEVEVAGTASSGEDAVQAAEALKPDVVVMDIQMSAMNGIEATTRIRSGHAPPAVLVLTMFDDDDSVFAAMTAGAQGYLLKEADREEIVRAILAVASGEYVFGPAIARRMLNYFLSRSRGDARENLGVFPQLTQREHQVLDLLAAGLNNTAIGKQLSICTKTVRNHVSSIFFKLRLSDRPQAIIVARNAGLGKTESLVGETECPSHRLEV